jgi:hypothetical protein
MSQSTLTQPFAYIIIVEPEDDVRALIQQTVTTPNCAVDVARDEDEAALKAALHRPQLIIVKQHEPISLDWSQPPLVNTASSICCRARLSSKVRLVTHTDSSLAFKDGIPFRKTFSEPDQYLLIRVYFKNQRWRKEWYSYCGRDLALKFLSDQLPLLLGRTKKVPSWIIGPFKPWALSDKINYN